MVSGCARARAREIAMRCARRRATSPDVTDDRRPAPRDRRTVVQLFPLVRRSTGDDRLTVRAEAVPEMIGPTAMILAAVHELDESIQGLATLASWGGSNVRVADIGDPRRRALHSRVGDLLGGRLGRFVSGRRPSAAGIAS